MGRLILFIFLLSSMSSIGLAQGQDAVKQAAASQEHHYPDFGYAPPPQEYAGEVFRLSQTYPREVSADPLPEFFKIDFKDRAQWKNYMAKVRDYCFEGNIDGENVESHWRVGEQKNPRWFHMPWQHYGPNGREALHGLTKEAPVKPGQFAQGQTYDGGQVYAVGFFNAIGAYTIGRVWENPQHPEARLATFREGTVICKPLFTDVPVGQVPFLVNALQWDAYITENYKSTDRRIRKVSLIQMDIAVRDGRSPTGWVFGTFQYNGAKNEQILWKNLVPVGVQWGNDPGIRDTEPNPFPLSTHINRDLKETYINEDPELPPTHLGWNGRLNGPVDNPMSACLSCHMTAQAPDQTAPLGPMFISDPPAPGSKKWMIWFQNLKPGERFVVDQEKDIRTNSTDFSLQLSRSLQSFYEWRSLGTRINAEQYVGHRKSLREAMERKAQREAEGKSDRHTVDENPGTGEKVYKILRNGPTEN